MPFNAIADAVSTHYLVNAIQFFAVRPVVETGYENVLLVKLLLEMRLMRMPSIQKFLKIKVMNDRIQQMEMGMMCLLKSQRIEWKIIRKRSICLKVMVRRVNLRIWLIKTRKRI